LGRIFEICHFILQGTAKRIAKVCTECKLEIDEEKYVEQFGPGMMDVVYNWCRGATFSSIMENTQLFEGFIFLVDMIYPYMNIRSRKYHPLHASTG
jgi:superfamily II RNA helicase